MLFSLTNFEPISLRQESLCASEERFAPLVAASHQPCMTQMSVAPLDPNFAPAKQVISNLMSAQGTNNDAWIQVSKGICEPIALKLAPAMGGNPAPRPSHNVPTQINATTPKPAESE